MRFRIVTSTLLYYTHTSDVTSSLSQTRPRTTGTVMTKGWFTRNFLTSRGPLPSVVTLRLLLSVKIVSLHTQIEETIQTRKTLPYFFYSGKRFLITVICYDEPLFLSWKTFVKDIWRKNFFSVHKYIEGWTPFY